MRLVDLEKLSQTKGKGGKTAMDYLARVLEDDAFDREEGLDGAEIDRALRVIAPKLKAGAENAIAEKTLEVKQREMNALNALDHPSRARRRRRSRSMTRPSRRCPCVPEASQSVVCIN